MKRRLEDVRRELEEAVSHLGGGDLQGDELYQLYEMVAIQILDSEHQDFAPEELQRYLTSYLDKLSKLIGRGE